MRIGGSNTLGYFSVQTSLHMLIKGFVHPRWTRREALRRMAGGFGMLGLSSVLHADNNALGSKPPHFPAKAKRIIYLVMNGGMSHVDTFDPKPMLVKYN